MIVAGIIQSHTGLPKVELKVMAKPGAALIQKIAPESLAASAPSEGSCWASCAGRWAGRPSGAPP